MSLIRGAPVTFTAPTKYATTPTVPPSGTVDVRPSNSMGSCSLSDGPTPSTWWAASAATAVWVRVASTTEFSARIAAPSGTLSPFAGNPTPDDSSSATTV